MLITRAAAQAADFARLLREAGAEVLEAPTIAIEPPPSWQPLDQALGRLGSFQWVVFTSVNGVAMVDARLAHLGISRSALARARVAAIGPATAAALEARGVRVEIGRFLTPSARLELVRALRTVLARTLENLLNVRKLWNFSDR